MRRQSIILVVFSCLLAMAGWQNCCAQSNQDNPIGEAIFETLPENLQTKAIQRYEALLNAVVKTRRIEEKQFVSEVVELVAAQELPKSLVDSSWLWIRKNRPYTNYPFIYFERILRLQADKVGIEIPKFDQKIYSDLRNSFVPAGIRPTIPR